MYNAYITKIKNLRKHSNADRLQCGECFGNTVIVDMKTTEGQLGVYFPVDGQLGQEYSVLNNLLRKKDQLGNNIGGYLDPDKRNITAIKLRGEKSDGLFMPIESLQNFTDITKLKVGDIINTINGIIICQKYIPRTNRAKIRINTTSSKKKVVRETYPLFAQHVDTQQLAYNLKEFKEGDIIYLTLKMHGTSQRTAYTIKKVKKQNWFQRLFKIQPKKTWEYITGTRRVTLTNFNKVTGYYGNELFRKTYHDYFKDKLNKGEEVFYEVLGYVNENTLIMGECDNKKSKDKEFIKLYGDTTKFTYGCKPNENIIRVYRMTMTNEDGYVVEYPTELVKKRCEEMGVEFVPILDKFVYTTEEDLMERVNKLCDGVDPVGLTHIREGIVARIDNSITFKAFKHKNFYFKVLEGIIKSDAIMPDMEEVQDITEGE